MQVYRTFLIGLLLQLCLTNSSGVDVELELKFIALHDVGLAELVSQGTSLFLSAFTGIDFTEWEVKPVRFWSGGSDFDIIANIPASEFDRVENSTRTYVSSGMLDEDFLKQGLEVNISFWQPIPSASISSTTTPTPSVTPTPSKSRKVWPSTSPTPSKSIKVRPSTSPTPSKSIKVWSSAIPSTSTSRNPYPSTTTSISSTVTASPLDILLVSDSASLLNIIVASYSASTSKITHTNLVSDHEEMEVEPSASPEIADEVLLRDSQELPSVSLPPFAGAELNEEEIDNPVGIPQVSSSSTFQIQNELSSDEITEAASASPIASSIPLSQEASVVTVPISEEESHIQHSPYPSASSSIAERDFVLGPDEELSEQLNFTISSPVFGFNSDLRDAFKWLLSQNTQTDAEKWIMWDLYEELDGSYFVVFRHIGTKETNEWVIEEARALILSGELEKQILEIDQSGNFEVSLESEAPNPEELDTAVPGIGNFIDPSMEPYPSIVATVPEPKFSKTEELLPLELNISSPVHGFGEELEDELVSFTSAQVNLGKENWYLQKAEKVEYSGSYNVLYFLKVDKDETYEISGKITDLVRKKSIDSHLQSIGYEGVSVSLVPRVLNSTSSSGEKSSQQGALKPSAGTIAASVVGIAVVMIIGIVVGLHCLPKSKRPVPQT